jgi:pimeloyl-ACP methyl ester carboxylesterase
MTEMPALDATVLPPGIRSRFIDGINGLRMHVLEAGFETADRPCVLLLHGFPELAFSWRKVMPQLAAAGYHVLAPDQRGYGRTTGWDGDYDGDLGSFRLLNLVRDALGLVSAFGLRQVEAVVGHDFGSSVAAWCALVRPDVFRSVVLMSAPFAGPPPLPFATAGKPLAPRPEDPVHRDLAALPRPRKHYQWYYSTRAANADMQKAPQGVHDFLRAYYHHKSADWPGAEMPPAEAIAACAWLPDHELAFYAGEYARNGFQGGLQWYRCGTSGAFNAEMETYSGRRIDVPSCFISGAQDWGIYQRPGAIEAMQTAACSDMRGIHLIDGAGHWVQQEQPDQVSRLLLQFFEDARPRSS